MGKGNSKGHQTRPSGRPRPIATKAGVTKNGRRQYGDGGKVK